MLTAVQPDILEAMAKALNDYRAERYLTFDEFAELLGITPRTLWRITKGKVHPRPTTMRKIAERLGVHPSQIAEFALRSVEDEERL